MIYEKNLKMQYIEKETGEKVSLKEIEKTYKEIKSNVDFEKEHITGWDTLEEFMVECYYQINGVNYPVFQKGKTFYNIKSLNGKTIITKNIRGF